MLSMYFLSSQTKFFETKTKKEKNRYVKNKDQKRREKRD